MKSDLDGRRILLGVTGGIAAYKSVFLLRLLKNEGADVTVVMTESAVQFVAPLTFETLSEHPVHIRMFGTGADKGTVSPIEHIDLAKWPELIVIAPTTANTLAKLAGGRADDLLTSIVSAYNGKVALAPAMNDVMWQNAATQENLRLLSTRGYRVIPPRTGDLACGYEAEGRLAEPEAILSFVRTLFQSDFAALRVLVSVGGTEEDLDPVRVISNRSSGRMGFAIAEAARERGAQVTCVVGRVSVPAPVGVRVVPVRTSSEMSSALKELFVDSDMLVMAAAVSDYKMKAPLTHKKKGDSWTVELTQTEDILQALGKMKGKRFAIGFALETQNIEANAKDKLARKNCDLLVVNNPLEKGAAFEHDTNRVTIYNEKGKLMETGLQSKREIADLILDTAREEKAFQKIVV